MVVIGTVVQLERESNVAIACDLGLVKGTVRIHVSAILKTLSIGNRTQAAILANRYFKDSMDSTLRGLTVVVAKIVTQVPPA